MLAGASSVLFMMISVSMPNVSLMSVKTLSGQLLLLLKMPWPTKSSANTAPADHASDDNQYFVDLANTSGAAYQYVHLQGAKFPGTAAKNSSAGWLSAESNVKSGFSEAVVSGGTSQPSLFNNAELPKSAILSCNWQVPGLVLIKRLAGLMSRCSTWCW